MLDYVVKLFDQSGGLLVVEIKVLHGPDMGSLATLMKRINQREGGEGTGPPTCLQ